MTLDKQPNFRPGFHHPSYDEGNNNKYLWWTLAICFALVVGLGYCAVPGQSQEGVLIHIQNFGKPMTPGLPPYRNDPEGIVKSEDFYSLMPGGRELRSGFSDLIPYDTIAYTTTSPIDAFTIFTPRGDSTAIIFAAGGYYYTFNAGYQAWISGGPFHHAILITVPDTVVEIQPYTPGKITVDTTTLKVKGTGVSRFIRDLQVGDSLISSNDANLRYKISHIVDDSILFIKSTTNDSAIANEYIARRGYTDTDGIQPYFHAANGLLYTGNQLNRSQIIYSLDSVLRLRTMGIVDSFLIDTVYTLYPPRKAKVDSSLAEDFARWDSLTTYPRISWDTTLWRSGAQGDTDHVSFYAHEFMLVNRRKVGQWDYNQWVESVAGGTEAYYLRIGTATSPSTGTFFQIKANDDSAIYLSTWYVDSTEILMGTDDPWNDSIFFGLGTSMEDTIDAADVDGKWAYIYSSAGFQDIIVSDANTGVVTIKAGGAIFYTTDANFPIDTSEMFKGMHFIHLTGSDIDFPATAFSRNKTKNQRTVVYEDPNVTFSTPDTLISQTEVWRCPFDSRWWDSPEEAEDRGRCRGQDLTIGWRYTYATVIKNEVTNAARAVGNDYFAIRYMRKVGDTVYFITNISTNLTDENTDTTSNWEIVRTGLPNWSGMTGWGTPKQLIAWGDTLAPGLLSFSGVNDHWNWSANDDILVGNNLNDPIMFVAGDYDGQAVVFKREEMFGYNGVRLNQLSASDGLVASGAVLQLEKEIFWLDADGPKWMERRDFSGYSIRKLGSGMDPLFNAWSSAIYSTDVVPYIINPAYIYKSLMAWNKRDNHIYLFFPGQGNTTNNRVAIFNMNTRQWDGILTIPASTAGSFNINDTLRIVVGSPTDAAIYALDYAYNDDGVGIDGQITSAKFYLTDAQGFPMKSKLGMVQFVYRTNKEVDTLELELIGDDATTTFYPEGWRGFAPVTDFVDIFRPSTENVSMFWQWDIDYEGKDAGSVFIPHDLYIQLLPVERND